MRLVPLGLVVWPPVTGYHHHLTSPTVSSRHLLSKGHCCHYCRLPVSPGLLSPPSSATANHGEHHYHVLLPKLDLAKRLRAQLQCQNGSGCFGSICVQKLDIFLLLCHKSVGTGSHMPMGPQEIQLKWLALFKWSILPSRMLWSSPLRVGVGLHLRELNKPITLAMTFWGWSCLLSFLFP